MDAEICACLCGWMEYIPKTLTHSHTRCWRNPGKRTNERMNETRERRGSHRLTLTHSQRARVWTCVWLRTHSLRLNISMVSSRILRAHSLTRSGPENIACGCVEKRRRWLGKTTKFCFRLSTLHESERETESEHALSRDCCCLLNERSRPREFATTTLKHTTNRPHSTTTTLATTQSSVAAR